MFAFCGIFALADEGGRIAVEIDDVPPHLIKELLGSEGSRPNDDGASGYDATALRDFFAEVKESGEEEDKAIAEDVLRLGSEEFGVREAAEWRLTRRIWVPIEDLRKLASDDADVEIKLRLRKVESRRFGFVANLLDGVRAQGVEVFVSDLFNLAKRLPAGDPVLDELAELIESADPEKAAVALRENIGHPQPRLRRAAVRGIGKSEGDHGELLAKLLEDGDERVRLEAAVALVRSGDLHGIEGLLDLLGSTSNDEVRSVVQSVLTTVAGREVAAYAETKEEASKAMEEWSAWRDGLKGRPLDPVAGLDDSLISGRARLKTDRDSYAAGKPIIVTFSGMPGKEADWITIVEHDTPPTNYNEYFYLKGAKRGKLEFRGLPAGTYEVRGYHDWPDGGYEIKVKKKITVK